MERFPSGKAVDDFTIDIISNSEYILGFSKMENHIENIKHSEFQINEGAVIFCWNCYRTGHA